MLKPYAGLLFQGNRNLPSGGFIAQALPELSTPFVEVQLEILGIFDNLVGGDE